jgi:hypothetical protein
MSKEAAAMRWVITCMCLLLSAVNLRAQQQTQEHCPANGQSKTGGNPTISWTSYMVKTDGGICVERSVHTQGQMYINWPAADINRLWVINDWSTKRCCFSDSTVKDGELEYGILGSKLHTTVYQGHNEMTTAGSEGMWMTGQLLSGNNPLNVNVAVTWTSSVNAECGKLKEPCLSNKYVVTNSDAPLSIKWDRDLVPDFTFQPKQFRQGYMLDSGTTAGFAASNKLFVDTYSSTDLPPVFGPVIS